MSLAGKIALITGVTSVMGEKFEPHETANSLAPSLIRTRAVKHITPKEIEAHHHYILVRVNQLVLMTWHLYFLWH